MLQPPETPAATPSLQRLTENIPVGTYVAVVHPDGRPEFTFVSNRWLEICGLTREAFMADQGLALEVIHPHDRQDMLEANLRAMASREPFRWEGRLLVSDTIVWVSIESNPRAAGDLTVWEGVMIDITRRKQAESELVVARETLERTAFELTENIPVGTYTMVLEPGAAMARFSFMSTRFLELTGLDREAAARDPLLAFACVHPDDYDAWVELNAEAFANKRRFFGETRVVVDGQVRWITAESIPRDLPDGSVVWEGVLIDISERRLAEQALRENLERLNQANAELFQHRHHLEDLVRNRTVALEIAKNAAQAADRAKSTFLANMSHELRTPLNGILGYTQLARRRATDPAQIEHLDKTILAGKSLLGLIENLLDLARIEAKRLPIAHVPFRLDQLIQATLARFRPLAEAKSLVVESQAEGADLETPLLGDPARVDQVVSILLDNAVKFSPSGTVALRTGAHAAQGEAVAVCIRVSDQGIGIGAAERERIFTSFEQADGGSTRVYGGAGLGLPLARQLAKMMGGDVTLEPQSGPGSTFRFSFVARRADETVGVAAGGFAPAELLRGEFAHTSVLLVDQDAARAERYSKALEAAGLMVDWVSSPDEAKAMAQSVQFPLILLGIGTNPDDAIETARTIGNTRGQEEAVVLAIEAALFESRRNDCIKAGFNGALPPGDSPETLYATVLHWLKHRSGRRTASH